jgi:segregation and condensation protein A
MAAWLAYLKSRLLLPEPPSEDGEPTAEELAARLTRQLERLEAMRDVAARLMARPRVGQDMFMRGAPEGIRVIRKSVYELSLVELLKAYADHKVSHSRMQPLRLRRSFVWSVEDAYARLSSLLGTMPEWSMLASYLPPDLKDTFSVRSAWASTLVASLEMSKQGRVELNQPSPFGPIYLKPIQRQEEDPA